MNLVDHLVGKWAALLAVLKVDRTAEKLVDWKAGKKAAMKVVH